MLSDCWFGCLEAGALADALGAPHELKFKAGPYTGFLEYETKVGRRYHEPLIIPVGKVTDDTDMTLALTAAIVKDKKWNQDTVIKNYLDWANANTYYLGKGTRKYLCGIKTVKGFLNRKAKLDQEYGQNQQGDGPLMRAAPLAFTKREEVWMADCSLTNNNDVSRACVKVYVKLLRACLFQKSFDEKMNIIVEFFQENSAFPFDKLKEDVWSVQEKVRDMNQNKSWIVHSLYCALVGLIYFRKVENRVKAVIDWVILLGGDTDTNARIAACLIGAEEGSEKFRSFEENVRNLEILWSANPHMAPMVDQVWALTELTEPE